MKQINYKEIENLIEEYCKKDGQMGVEYANALRMNFNKLTSIKELKEMTKILAVNLAETAYIDNAQAIKVGECFYNKFDYGRSLGIAGKFEIVKKAKRSLGRLLCYIQRKIYHLESDLNSKTARVNDLRESISLLMQGKAKIVKCSICEGSGRVYDDNDNLIVCWNCDGDKKIIEPIIKLND